MSYEHKLHLLLSDSRGVYIPRDFATNFDLAQWGISFEDVRYLDDPYHEFYWEVWDTILSTAETLHDGHKWRLYQDGNLWAVRADMTEEEWGQAFGF